jgi:hypothetical protein
MTLRTSRRRPLGRSATHLSALVALALLTTLAVTASAQEYLFSVPKMLLAVEVNPDASVTLEYTIDFQCAPGAHAIDAVDVGLPHGDYDMSQMVASVDGERVYSFEKSPYVEYGVAVNLGDKSIQPGASGRFSFLCRMPSMVWQDTTRKDYASLRITPTWFGSQYVQGTTDLYVTVYLPKDLKPDEVLYQDERQPFNRKFVTDKYTMVEWRFQGTRLDGPHMVGLSFPKRNMTHVMYMTPFALFMKWWRESPNVRIVWAVVLFILFGIMFFRASAGTGCSCFVPLLILLIACFSASPGFELAAFPVLLLVWYFTERGLKRRRGHYLPPIASVEGGGIKRGLTAPEAAVLLELPLNRVLALVLFGLLKKGIVKQLDAKPLSVALNPGYEAEERSARRKQAQDQGTVIHAYEQRFIDALREAKSTRVDKVNFKPAMEGLIVDTATRLKGFDVEKTRSYYKLIVSKAWSEAKGLGDLEERTAYTDDNLLWLLLAPDYHDNFGTWYGTGYHYDPPWIRTGPVFGGGGIPTPTPDAGVGGHTSFGDVAASFAGWTENVAGGLASSIDGLTVPGARGGVVDLSGVDKVSLDVLETMSSSSGSGGGGGGGGCACACAGCACACACAGGGR